MDILNRKRIKELESQVKELQDENERLNAVLSLLNTAQGQVAEKLNNKPPDVLIFGNASRYFN